MLRVLLFAGISRLARISYHWYLYMKTHNLQAFQKTAQDFVRTLFPAGAVATVVGLYGDLGAGKTTFVQAIAKALGVVETVNSPTFLIVKSYQFPVQSFKTLIHIDAYRLKNSDELRKLRFDELLADPNNLIIIEWADKVSDILPPDHRQLFFEFVDETTRKILNRSTL